MAQKHPSEALLALYSSGDLDLKDRLQTAWHVRTCSRCRAMVDDFAADRQLRVNSAEAMQLPANWDALAEEMTANIRLGLSASECVRPAGPIRRKVAIEDRSGWFWKPALGLGLSMVLLVAALFTSQRGVFQRVWNAAAYGVSDNGLTVLESSADGVEMRSGPRSAMSLKVDGRKANQYSASLDGSVRAQYVDDDLLQVTVTNVYAQ
ncbi:hypothetical protein F183_A16070 [Bryobacterales bacterium F-183]|nr:hypothetical protein F183_A16070 [Bryobacterales bacterium F-183]